MCDEETKVERATLDKRVGFLNAVLGKEQEPLNILIGQFKVQGDEKPQSDSVEGSALALATSWHSQLDVPPCEKFQELKSLASFSETVDEQWQSSNATELKERCKKRSEARRPITELSQACAAGLKELRKAMASFDQRAKAKAESITSVQGCPL